MAGYSIKDLEKISGIKAHTIRIWEKRYSLFCPDRNCSNIRNYQDEDLKKLMNIAILNRFGYKISEIARLTHQELAERVLDVSQSQPDIDFEIENLIMAMLDFDELKFNKCLSRIILRLGFEEAFIRVVAPFFRKIGTMWQVGSISPGHEHFISNLVRNKLIVATENLERPSNEKAKTFLLALPDSEIHETGLLFCDYYLKKRGHRTVYLGQCTPLSEISNISRKLNPDFLLISYITAIPVDEYENQVHQLALDLPGQSILLTGLQATSNMIKLPLNVCIATDADIACF
jgi:MerR family transcriptional regulator, light-induced transcriptional regulator